MLPTATSLLKDRSKNLEDKFLIATNYSLHFRGGLGRGNDEWFLNFLLQKH